MDESGRALAVLSIQSGVVYGHVGNNAASLPLQRLGIEVWPLNTVQFSNHTGYGAWRGHVHTLDQIRALIDGIAARGVLATCRGLLSGYLGDVALGETVLEAARQMRAHAPDLLYACDPVIGDADRGVFVRPDIPAFFRDHAMAAADLITPNAFELAFLSGRAITSIDDAGAAADALRARGPARVAVTSLELDGDPGALHVLLIAPSGAFAVRTPKIDIALNGTGDTFTALLLGCLLRGAGDADALTHAVNAMFTLVETTARLGRRELAQVDAQDAFAAPPLRFAAVRIA